MSFFSRYSAALAQPTEHEMAAKSAITNLVMWRSPWMRGVQCAKLEPCSQEQVRETTHARNDHVSRRQSAAAGSVRQPPHLGSVGRKADPHCVHARRQGV